jgi:predicted phage baseplate assembly protein
MPLPMPRLDNRRFDQLVEEGSALLPRYAPGWTDHNLHDPGITLIDLLAWLVEMDMYRLDRTSQAAYRAFLRLVGIELRPPQVAETVLVFNVIPGNLQTNVSAGVQVASQDDRVKFQTIRNLTVLPSLLTTVLTGSEDALLDRSEQNRNTAKRFAPFGPDPQPNHALYLGFDQPLPASSRRVSLYIWVNSVEQDRELRQRLIDEGRVETTLLKACNPRMSCHRHSLWPHYSARTVWEYYTEPGTWLPLRRVFDETHGLTLSGAVRFTMPAAPPHAKGAVITTAGLFFIRCRLVSGYYECPPEIQHIALNAVPARHTLDIKVIEEQADSNGRAGQTFQLKHAPVAPGSTRLRVLVNGLDEEWHEALNWDQVGPHNRTYLLSPETGQIVFGDGLHGRVPMAGAKISVVSYRSGGGLSGNVRAGALTRYLGSEKVEVGQPCAASGGADAESLPEAKGRAITWLTEPQRAVTLGDFEHLALATPGVPVKRALALADYDPALPELPALGSVTVVVVPCCAIPIPEPGPDMLRAVERYLDRRRTLTTELHVISPSFITVAVRAVLHAGIADDTRDLTAAAQSKLNTFLDPLRGGTDGQGWPIGRDVYQSEVMALLNAIPGVNFVDEVGMVIESELDVYQGYVTWMQVFERAGSTTTLRAQLRIEPQRAASRVTAQAQIELERYFQSPRGRTKHITQHARRGDVAMILSATPGMLHVEEVKLDDEPGSGALCGNVPVCAHSLVVPGKHQISVSGARTNKHVRASRPPC